MQVENYHCYNSIRPMRLGGGVSLLIHESLTLNQIIACPFTDTFKSIGADVLFHGTKLFFGEFYRVPNTSENDFREPFNTFLDTCSNYATAFVCSDQNYDLLKMDTHKPTMNFAVKMSEKLFFPAIIKPTRVSHTTSTLIDNVRVKVSRMNDHVSYIITNGMSDHYPCFVSYRLVNFCKDKSETYFEK